MSNIFYTNDLSFAAYLHMQGFELTSAKRLGKSFKFSIDLVDKDDKQVKLMYLNSEARKFDASVRDLKKVLFGGT